MGRKRERKEKEEKGWRGEKLSRAKETISDICLIGSPCSLSQEGISATHSAQVKSELSLREKMMSSAVTKIHRS